MNAFETKLNGTSTACYSKNSIGDHGFSVHP